MERLCHQWPSSDEDCAGGFPDAHRPPTTARTDFPTLRGFLPCPSLLLPSLVFLFVTILLLLPPQLTAQPLQPRQQRPLKVAPHAPTSHIINHHKMESLRTRRQSKPEESIWQLYFRLMREGTNDTASAYQQIRQLFSTLIESGKPRENLSTTENTTVTEETGGGEGGVDGAAGANETVTTTTTEPTPRKISTSELMDIFRRNVFGLGRLFGREFWNAIQQSNKNIEMYSKQWQDAIRPFVQ